MLIFFMYITFLCNDCIISIYSRLFNIYKFLEEIGPTILYVYRSSWYYIGNLNISKMKMSKNGVYMVEHNFTNYNHFTQIQNCNSTA